MFNGFDVVISESGIGYYQEVTLHGGYTHAYFKLNLEFIGDFEGSTRLTTKHITEIKRTNGFKEYVFGLIMDEVNAKQEEINEALATQTKYEKRLRTWYSHGRVEITTNLGGGREQFEEDMGRLLDEFIVSHTTKSTYPQ